MLYRRYGRLCPRSPKGPGHERYRSYRSGVGARIAAGETSLRELSDYALTVKDFSVESGRQEYLESVLNNILFC